MNKDFLQIYRDVVNSNISIFHLSVLEEIYFFLENVPTSDETVLNMASIVIDAYLKADDHVSLSAIAEIVVHNYDDIINNNMSSRDILSMSVF